METIETFGVVKFDITTAAIAEMKDRYMKLTVKGLDDKDGFDAVHEARMIVKGKRIDVEKRRKDLKASALEYGRKVDAKAKELFSLLEPIELHLTEQEEIITKEKERIKAEEERKLKEKIQKRVDDLFAYNVVLPYTDVATMTDDEYANHLAQAKETYDAEQKRLEEERIKREAEEAKLKAEREEFERQQAELRAAQEKIEAERRAIEEEKRKEQERRDREEFERKAREEAKIKAEKEAAAKVEREKREAEEAARKAKEKEEAEKAEAARLEKLRPDREKLTVWQNKVLDVPSPELSSEEARRILSDAKSEILMVFRKVQKKVREM